MQKKAKNLKSKKKLNNEIVATASNTLQITDFARAQGEKLAFFLTAAKTPDPLKESIIFLLSNLTSSQVLDFIDKLESNFWSTVLQPMDDELVRDVKNIKDENDKKRAMVLEQYTTDIEQFTQVLTIST